MLHLRNDAIEERAAILEYDAGLPRKGAENKAAQMHGFKDWREYQNGIRNRTKDAGSVVWKG